MIAVMKHELSLFYHSMTGYIFGAFLLCFTGIGATIYNISSSVANFEYVLNFISIVFILIVPILTMRIIADERKQRTDQLLYSLPITTTDIVVGKFLALAVVYLIPLVVVSFYPLLFRRFGDVYLPTSYSAITGFFFLGIALISMGMFVSSLTDSQGMAAGICLVVMLLNYYCAMLAEYVSTSSLSAAISIGVLFAILGLVVRSMTKSDYIGIAIIIVGAAIAAALYFLEPDILEDLLPNLMKKLSLFERYKVFVNGLFDLTALLYYLSVTGFFLFLSVQSLEKRRYNG